MTPSCREGALLSRRNDMVAYAALGTELMLIGAIIVARS
jgi:hypothetical protein